MRTEDKVVVNSGVVCLPETADGLYNLVRVKDEAGQITGAATVNSTACDVIVCVYVCTLQKDTL